MHSLNHAVLGRQIADERAQRAARVAQASRQPDRPPPAPARRRVGWARRAARRAA